MSDEEEYIFLCLYPRPQECPHARKRGTWWECTGDGCEYCEVVL